VPGKTASSAARLQRHWRRTSGKDLQRRAPHRSLRLLGRRIEVHHHEPRLPVLAMVPLSAPAVPTEVHKLAAAEEEWRAPVLPEALAPTQADGSKSTTLMLTFPVALLLRARGALTSTRKVAVAEQALALILADESMSTIRMSRVLQIGLSVR